MESWDVEFTDQFIAWWDELPLLDQRSVSAKIVLLEEKGPNLGFPHTSGVQGSRHGNMSGRTKFSELTKHFTAEDRKAIERGETPPARFASTGAEEGNRCARRQSASAAPSCLRTKMGSLPHDPARMPLIQRRAQRQRALPDRPVPFLDSLSPAMRNVFATFCQILPVTSLLVTS